MLGAEVWIKHENLQPTQAFKVRNALSALTALSPEDRARGVVAATRGNHGLGLAYASRHLGIQATLCVPVGNNPEKNSGIRSLGARLIEEGRDYDESVEVMNRLVEKEELVPIHSTNNREVIAGAATLTWEILEQNPALDALVISVGGGSQAVGAITVARALKPGLEVYGVQAAGAPAIHDSWHAGKHIAYPSADTFADGLATRSPYPLTFEALRAGLKDFVKVSDDEIADALRLCLATTHTLVEGAGAAALAGLRQLGGRLRGRKVGVVISGGNIDRETLRRILA
jgi:threonine dehydratase